MDYNTNYMCIWYKFIQYTWRGFGGWGWLGIPGSRQFWLITEVVAVLGHDLGYWNTILSQNAAHLNGIWSIENIWKHLKTIVGATCCKPLLSTLVTQPSWPSWSVTKRRPDFPSHSQILHRILGIRCHVAVHVDLSKEKISKNGTHQSSGAWI